MMPEGLLAVIAYLVGYSLLFIISKVTVKHAQKHSNSKLEKLGIALHLIFVLLSLPALTVYAYLFSNLKHDLEFNFLTVAIFLSIGIISLLHLFATGYMVKRIYHLISKKGQAA